MQRLDQIQDLMPPGRAHLRDQLDRAGTSIVLNIAEGAGEFSLPDKQRLIEWLPTSSSAASPSLWTSYSLRARRYLQTR